MKNDEKVIDSIIKRKKYKTDKIFKNPTPETKRRIKEVISAIRKGWSKHRIEEHYAEKWNVAEDAVYNYVHDAVLAIGDSFDREADKCRDISLERIEYILERSLNANDNRTALAAIDMINKLYSLYVDKKEVKADISEWKFTYDKQ